VGIDSTKRTEHLLPCRDAPKWPVRDRVRSRRRGRFPQTSLGSSMESIEARLSGAPIAGRCFRIVRHWVCASYPGGKSGECAPAYHKRGLSVLPEPCAGRPSRSRSTVRNTIPENEYFPDHGIRGHLVALRPRDFYD